jgi:hypothetical protein
MSSPRAFAATPAIDLKALELHECAVESVLI